MNTIAKLQPRIENIASRKLVGQHMSMSILNNKTGELWRNFMPRWLSIQNRLSDDLFSINLYDSAYFSNFNPGNQFIKWAAVEIESHAEIPDGFEEFNLPGGLYAVFNYKGLSSDTRIFQYIFSEWLPNSGYELANRPHFELLGNKYKNNDPESEEDIYIPVRSKK